MTYSQLRAQVVSERIAWINQMLVRLRGLPLDTYAAFTADPRNVAAAESYLRRALEALLDLGRHVLAKGFGQAVVEYKEIASVLAEVGVLNREDGVLLAQLAGYRNRLVHFYQEVTDEELYRICSTQSGDIETLLAAILAWIKAHPEMIDQTL